MTCHTPLTPLIRYLPANGLGRDFAVGDLHGCRQMLDALLAKVRFDPAIDRLFSVGDLVDRGPDSIGCLALLKEPWFHAVRGNHETMLLDYLWSFMQYGIPLRRTERHEFLLNGGEWIYRQYDFTDDTLHDELAAVLPLVRQLPLLIAVGEGAERFNIVHADLYDAGKPDGVLRDADIDALAEKWRTTDFADVNPEDYPYWTSRWLWSRRIMGGMESQLSARVPDLSPTYCGHTIAPHVRKALSHVCIDTGACMAGYSTTGGANYGLTLMEVKEPKAYFLGAGSQARPVPGSSLRLELAPAGNGT